MNFRVISTTLFLALCFSLAVAILAGSPSFQKHETLFFQLDLTSSAGGAAQLFFDTGRGFVEKDSASQQVRQNQTTRHQFPVPRGRIFNIRFDPINLEADVTIAAPMIVNSAGAIIHRFEPKDFTAGQHIKAIDRQDDRVVISCTEGGFDPSLMVALPPDLRPSKLAPEWLRATSLLTVILFTLMSVLALACYTFAGTVFNPLAKLFHARPWRTLAILSALGTLLQLHPLFFPASSPNGSGSVLASSQTSIFNLEAYNLINGKLSPPPASLLEWANIFSLVPNIFGDADWAIAASIIGAWWGYVFGCALLALLITRSLSTGVIIAMCALFTKAWSPGVLPLSVPAIVFAPWILIGWWVVATAPRSSRLFFMGGASIFIAYLQMTAVEFSPRVIVLILATAAAGILSVALQLQSRANRLLRAGAGLAFFTGFVVVVCIALWYASPLPSHLNPWAAKVLFPAISANAALSLFDGFLWQSPTTNPFPSANLVVLAGVVWALVRSDENVRSPVFIASTVVIFPLAVLAAGIVTDGIAASWNKHLTAAQVQEAAWYTLVFFFSVVASFGFAGLRQFCASPDSGSYVAKATIFFFSPFLLYYGTFAFHAYYTFRSAFVVSIILGWSIVHLAMMRLRNPPETRVLIAILPGAVMLGWWHHVAYIHLAIEEALAAP